MFGYAPNAMINQSIWDLSADTYQKEAIKNVLQNIFDAQPKPVPYFGTVTNTKNHKLNLRVDWDYLHSDKNVIIGILAVLQNVKNEKNNHKFHSPSLIDQVQYSRLASVEEVVARIAHELNQPLSAIMNFSNGALKHLQSSEKQEQVVSAIHMITKQAQRAGDVLQRIRDFIQKGELRKEFLNMNEVLEEVLDCMRQEIHTSKVNITFKLDSFLPAVLADKIQIEQVLLNIFQNAIESMQSNSADKPRNLSVETQFTDKNELWLTIEDTGHGIAPFDMNKIFDAFHSTKATGMGIGLAISQSIIHAHHGQLLVTSTEGKGSKFSICLPSR